VARDAGYQMARTGHCRVHDRRLVTADASRFFVRPRTPGGRGILHAVARVGAVRVRAARDVGRYDCDEPEQRDDKPPAPSKCRDERGGVGLGASLGGRFGAGSLRAYDEDHDDDCDNEHEDDRDGQSERCRGDVRRGISDQLSQRLQKCCQAHGQSPP